MSEGMEGITVLLPREIRDEVKGLGREVADVRTPCLGSFDRSRRLERRLEGTRDDLETTMEAEMMGTGLDWRRALEVRIEELEEDRKRPAS